MATRTHNEASHKIDSRLLVAASSVKHKHLDLTAPVPYANLHASTFRANTHIVQKNARRGMRASSAKRTRASADCSAPHTYHYYPLDSNRHSFVACERKCERNSHRWPHNTRHNSSDGLFDLSLPFISSRKEAGALSRALKRVLGLASRCAGE